MDRLKVALFIKKDKPTTKEVVEYLEANSEKLLVYHGKVGDKFPHKALDGTQDILISYLSPWIIPEDVLKRTRLWNINFHPAPPEYPGMACYGFAIYNGEKEYGVTAHIMEKKIDSGKIICVKRFPFSEGDSAYSLSLKSYEHMLSLFSEVMDYLLREHKLPEYNEVWKKEPYTLKKLEELRRINFDMPEDEISRRVRATSYPNMPRPYIEIHGHRLEIDFLHKKRTL